MPQANRMNRDRSDVMNNEATLVNGTTVNSGTTADNGTRIPVPHGLDDLEVQEWLDSLDSLLESSASSHSCTSRSSSPCGTGMRVPLSAVVPLFTVVPFTRVASLFITSDRSLFIRLA